MGSKGAKDAAKIQAQAAQQQIGLQRDIYNSQIQNLEPWRATGQGANNLLAQLYGLPYMDYSPAQSINGLSSGGFTNGKLTSGAGSYAATLGPEGFLLGEQKWAKNLDPVGKYASKMFNPQGGKPEFWQENGMIMLNGKKGGREQLDGYINPQTGEVVITNEAYKDLEAPLTEYLRTGKGDLPKNASRFASAVNAMRGAGWKYNPGSATDPETGLPAGYHEGTGKGDLSVFQNSPGYQFRLNEGLRAVQNSAAARGGLGGGNSLRAVNDYAQGTASDDFYNFVNQMNNMAGHGQTAVAGQQSAGTNFGIGAGNALGNYGDARASGVANSANMWGQAAMGAGNAFADWWSNRNSGTAPNNMQGLSPYTVQSQYKPVPGQSSGGVVPGWHGLWR